MAKTLAQATATLNDRQRVYVESRLKGFTIEAAKLAAGLPSRSHPEQDRSVQLALAEGREASAAEVGFTRKKAHDMLMDAYHNATTAAEQVQAVRELVKLHGVAAPTEVKHKHQHEHEHTLDISKMSDEELLKLAEKGRVFEGEVERAALPAPVEAA